jgi:hypothetical protein
MTYRSHDKGTNGCIEPHTTPKHSSAAIDENHIKQWLMPVHRSYDIWSTSPSCIWFPRWLGGCCQRKSKICTAQHDILWYNMIATGPSSLRHDLITQKLPPTPYNLKPRIRAKNIVFAIPNHEYAELATHPNTQGLSSAFKALLWKTALYKYVVFMINSTIDQSAVWLARLHRNRHRHYLNTKYRFHKWITSFTR